MQQKFSCFKYVYVLDSIPVHKMPIVPFQNVEINGHSFSLLKVPKLMAEKLPSVLHVYTLGTLIAYPSIFRNSLSRFLLKFFFENILKYICTLKKLKKN